MFAGIFQKVGCFLTLSLMRFPLFTEKTPLLLLAGNCKFGNSCRFVHEILADKPIPEVLCIECGTIHKGMPIERCLHTGEIGERRKGGWSSELSKWVCCDCTDKQSRVCVRHTSKDCDCYPKCSECGSAEHTSPMKSWFNLSIISYNFDLISAFALCISYHTGSYHIGRMGGWTPAEDGMAADWHCCGCDDSNNFLGCDNHNEAEKCACFHCTECGSPEHRYPLPACRHRGSG